LGLWSSSALRWWFGAVRAIAGDHVVKKSPHHAYHVGLDIASALHPQTLLCYEMDGWPQTPEHGAPLRLVIPVKYGIKNWKRIGNDVRRLL
jgi:DMSO/TMAO reductase YedYZ molybdopterin-dependent catalytic subunit